MTDIVKATFWGAVLFFAVVTFYCWFVAQPKYPCIGLGSFAFMLFIAWLGLQMKD